MATPRKLSAIALVAAVCMTACADLVPVDTSVAVTRTSEPGPVGTTQAPPGTDPAGTEATLLSVLDGDSLAVEIAGNREEVRLVGINTPESDECHGDEARSALMTIVDGAVLVLVETDAEDRDRFGRLLRDVWARGTWINESQVRNGHAVALQGGNASEASLVAAETAAFERGLGMWALDACGEAPTDEELEVRIGDIRFDPPGRDFENTEEEFVSIVNDGSADVDLTEWIIRDESSTHRFSFPDLELGAGEAMRIRTGCGQDELRDIYWCAGDAVWSNGGDTVILQTSEGNVVARLKYEGDF